jgi:hypothetical protein
VYDQISSLSLISSIIVGMTIGILIGFRWEIPRNIWDFIVCFVFNIFSIKIGARTFLFGGEVSLSQVGLVISPIIFSMFFVVNVLYLFRKLREKLYIAEEE